MFSLAACHQLSDFGSTSLTMNFGCFSSIFQSKKHLQAPPLPSISKLGFCLVWQPDQVEDPQYIRHPSPAEQFINTSISCILLLQIRWKQKVQIKNLTFTFIPSIVVAGRLLWWFLSNWENVMENKKTTQLLIFPTSAISLATACSSSSWRRWHGLLILRKG